MDNLCRRCLQPVETSRPNSHLCSTCDRFYKRRKKNLNTKEALDREIERLEGIIIDLKIDRDNLS